MTEGYLYRNGFDPAFFDDSDMIECDTCKREYDHNEYRSLTCDECENKLTTKEGENKMTKWIVTLELELEEGNPNKWNWHEVLDLGGNESVWVDVKEGESK